MAGKEESAGVAGHRHGSLELAFAHNRWAEAVDLLEGLYRDAQTVRSSRLMMQLKSALAITLMASNDADGAFRPTDEETRKWLYNGSAASGLGYQRPPKSRKASY